MEKAGRGKQVGPWLRLLICTTVDLNEIQNSKYITLIIKNGGGSAEN